MCAVMFTSSLLYVGAWLVPAIYLWYYLQGLRANLSDLRAAREEYLHPDPKRSAAPDDARRAMIGETVAFTVTLLLAFGALAVVLFGVVWFVLLIVRTVTVWA